MGVKLGDKVLLIGKKIRDLRKENKMTQTELGKKLNLTKVSISCYENGSRLPSLETLYKICDIFGVTLPYLAGRDRYIINEEVENYAPFNMANEEINFIKELRNHEELYTLIIDDPKRTIELIKKKLNK